VQIDPLALLSLHEISFPMSKPSLPQAEEKKELSFEEFKQTVLHDYQIACESREASLLGRKEVLTGKAKFGIFGDGKEIAQIALAKAFKPGDFRSGYYRDQTFMLATGLMTVRQFFAQLYAHADEEAEPMSSGRSMNGHFASTTVNPDGSFREISKLKNSSADISPTAGQMPRLLGLAYASKVYRNNPELKDFTQFSNAGNEVAFGTIGDASTSEGLFFEAMNAAGVLQVPLAMSVWDDGYGISVPTRYQTTKGNISKALEGFREDGEGNGILIFNGKGWDYPGLVEMYEQGVAQCRSEHKPVLFHIQEITQPQGHSTSGSHERYKSKERLNWEVEFDCIRKMREWISQSAIATAEELDQIEANAKNFVKEERRAAWDAFQTDIKSLQNQVLPLLQNLAAASGNEEVQQLTAQLEGNKEPLRRDVIEIARKVLRMTCHLKGEDLRNQLIQWVQNTHKDSREKYSSWLYNEGDGSALSVRAVPAVYDEAAAQVDGREILRDNYDKILETNPLFLVFGEDAGNIGGVNQTLEGMQKKYGEIRVSDTGIREATIIGQGIGLAMRGLRPIAEIQYLDYLLYAIQIMSDDLATLRYRTKGKQKAPLIISTRGHRLEGVWHSGSPMGMIINAIRGIYVCVPRNMTQAAGFYNTLLASDDPALVIEPLNGYRTKEPRPQNMGEFRVELGIPEILREGSDLTLVTYGSCCRIALDAATQLEQHGVSVEVIDVQTLLPFDRHHAIVESIKKTGKLLVVDEDVPGGASAFILQQILEVQGGFRYLDAEPVTLAAQEHRPAYGSDGDYFSKPSVDDMIETAYAMMNEYNPARFPGFYE
jgi:pyruvate/2-oxoglutarate/acetoin dehydrogenase E1 component/TPP-dependent pyruvate/acetoin dehydrogenase alpha subunit